MTTYMLHTNIASHVMRGDIVAIRQRLETTSQSNRIAFSVVSQAELFYGLAKRGKPKALKTLVDAFLEGVEVLPWTPDEAHAYGELRTTCEAAGLNLTTADMKIAAHTKSIGATLITRDAAFKHLTSYLDIEDWSQA